MPTQIGENRAKQMLKANALVLCMGVNQLRTPNIAMIAAACGFDAVYIDLEGWRCTGLCRRVDQGLRLRPSRRRTCHRPNPIEKLMLRNEVSDAAWGASGQECGRVRGYDLVSSR